MTEFLRGYIKGAQELIYAMSKAHVLSDRQRGKLDVWMEKVRAYQGDLEPPGSPDLSD